MFIYLFLIMFDVVKRRRILMRRRPSVDVVSSSIRRQLNVNTTPTLKQRQFNTCMTPMSVRR